MGISGHILGEKKLRRLRRLTGLPLDRAYRRGKDCEGRLLGADGVCRHYAIDPDTGEYRQRTESETLLHWVSCREPRDPIEQP